MRGSEDKGGPRGDRCERSGSRATCVALTFHQGLALHFFTAAGSAPRASREKEEAPTALGGRKWLRRAPGAARRVAVGGVPASKMAAAAAVSGAFGRAGWRFLQLRCLPGEGASEPGSGEERGGGSGKT